MPILTMFLIGLPVCPFQAPLRILPAKSAMRSSTAWTWGTTSSPSTTIDSPLGARRATCRTARSSVTLIFSPRNMASMRALQARFLGQLQQQPKRLVRDPVLGVIEEDARRPRPSAARRDRDRRRTDRRRCTSRIFCVVSFQGLPGGAVAQVVLCSWWIPIPDSRFRTDADSGSSRSSVRASVTIFWASATMASRWVWSRKLSA